MQYILENPLNKVTKYDNDIFSLMRSKYCFLVVWLLLWACGDYPWSEYENDHTRDSYAAWCTSSDANYSSTTSKSSVQTWPEENNPFNFEMKIPVNNWLGS